jgi:protein-S-isoprenylcysteine O-methyltransferase Ste14
MRWLPLILFLVFFTLALVGRTWIAWRRTGINPIVWPNDDSIEGFIARALHASTAALLAGLTLHGAAPDVAPLPWAGNDPAFAVGVVLFAAALLWVGIAQLQMGASWRVGIDHARPTALVERGLFRWSRNPIFLGMRVALLAALLMAPNAITLAAAVATELLMQLQTRLEEVHLLQLHGDTYRAYATRVNRWIGRHHP